MYVSLARPHERKEQWALFVAGVLFVSLICSLIGLAIAIYNKTFVDSVTVTLEADRAGLQLPKFGDVRYHDVVVGQVRDVSQSGQQAIVVLAIDPEFAENIPRNVDASILPTTLFGQKYVSLIDPAHADRRPLVDQQVIPSSRVDVTTELSSVLSRLFPVLRAVRPQDLNTALTALATGLNGRGKLIGETLEQLDAYLTVMNVHLPVLRSDLRLLASVAETYSVAAPDLLAALRSLTVTASTIREKEGAVGRLLDELTQVSDKGAGVLGENEINLDRAAELSRPLLQLLDRYSPQYDCLLRGLAKYKPILLKAFEGGEVKQFIEVPSPQVRAYDERDLPEYSDTRGPRCLGLPDNVVVPDPGYDTANGTDLDSPAGRGRSYLPGGVTASPDLLGDLLDLLLGRPVAADVDEQATSSRRRAISAAQISELTGVPTASIPDLSTLLFHSPGEEP